MPKPSGMELIFYEHYIAENVKYVLQIVLQFGFGLGYGKKLVNPFISNIEL